MKKILATSILLTLFVTAQGCGHYGSYKHTHGSEVKCDCENSKQACNCGGHEPSNKEEKKSSGGCTECAKGS